MRRRPPLYMSRRMRGTVYVILTGVWASGIAWLLLHYFARQSGPFGLTPSPWEPRTLAAHGAFSFAATWLFGWLCAAHLRGGWQSRRQRGSGASLALVFGLLIATGYLLYYLSGDRSRQAVAVIHWGMGLVILAMLLVHRIWRPQSRHSDRRKGGRTLPVDEYFETSQTRDPGGHDSDTPSSPPTP